MGMICAEEYVAIIEVICEPLIVKHRLSLYPAGQPKADFTWPSKKGPLSHLNLANNILKMLKSTYTKSSSK